MKLNKEMREAGKGDQDKIGAKEWSLWHYDYHGLYQKIHKLAEKLTEDWGWECWDDEERAHSYAIDVIENCIVKGLLEVSTPPGKPAPTHEELMDIIMTRNCGPDWKEKIAEQERQEKEQEEKEREWC